VEAGDDEDYYAVKFEGIEYMVNKEDMTVLDPESMETVGLWDKDSEEIEFGSDEAREKHEETLPEM